MGLCTVGNAVLEKKSIETLRCSLMLSFRFWQKRDSLAARMALSSGTGGAPNNRISPEAFRLLQDRDTELYT